MIAIKTAIFVALIGTLMWSGLHLGYAAVGAWPRWAVIEGGGAIGCLYGLTDLSYRWREWLGWSGERRSPRRSMFRRWH